MTIDSLTPDSGSGMCTMQYSYTNIVVRPICCLLGKSYGTVLGVPELSFMPA